MSSGNQHIALLLSSMRIGGEELNKLRLAQGLLEQGYRVDLVLIAEEGVLRSQIPDGVRVVDLRARRALTSLPKLTRYLREAKPDVLLSSLDYINITAIWARALSRAQTRLVVCEASTLSVHAKYSPKTRILPLLCRWFYSKADAIVAVSQGVADDLVQKIGIRPEKMIVIYNPIASPQLAALAEEPAKHRWFEQEQPPVCLAVGRLVPQKDYTSLIQAFAQVRASRQMKLIILGEGEERARLESLITALGLEEDIDMPGFVRNPYAYMKRARAFILSSKVEGLPTSLIEAMCCGTPLIATDCPSGPREILNGGEYGQLVPVGNVAKLASAIDQTLQHPSPPALVACKRFESRAVIDQYLNVLLNPS
jgi:glycosyltransferase involved in cell wall biosynthesis